MGKKSEIQWTDATWNVAVGCKKVDEDCKYCYMYRESLSETRYNPKEIRKTKTVFNLPLKLKEPSKIFTSSLTDLFIEEIDEYRNEVWNIIRKCPQHTFQILTKRPHRIVEQTPKDILAMSNVWFGTSIGSQKSIDRMEQLIDVPCQVRFISFEPLHGRVDIDWNKNNLNFIHWVILGGESGNENGKYRYRPCEIEWFEHLINTFEATSSIFVKQLGTHLAKKLGLKDRHGGNIDEFPYWLQQRNFPIMFNGENINVK